MQFLVLQIGILARFSVKQRLDIGYLLVVSASIYDATVNELYALDMDENAALGSTSKRTWLCSIMFWGPSYGIAAGCCV